MQRKTTTRTAWLILGLLVIQMVACAPVQARAIYPREALDGDRDKTGPNWNARFEGDLQELKEPPLTSDGSFYAEREGFEPAACTPPTIDFGTFEDSNVPVKHFCGSPALPFAFAALLAFSVVNIARLLSKESDLVAQF